MKTTINSRKAESLSTLIIIAAAFLFLYVFSASTSPLYDGIGFDQNIFNVVGRTWADGGLPYVSAWDSKGPVIFFVNMLGYRLTGNVTGVFIIEVVNLAATLLVAFFMLRRYFRPTPSFVLTMMYLAAFAFIFSKGNQVGEYATLLSVAATLLACRWTQQWTAGKPRHPWQYALVYGLFFGVCVLSRATNAVPMVIWTALIFFVLVGNRQWRNTMANIVAFVAGFAIVFVPFALYFAAHGAFGEMWYATITYNIEYMQHSNAAETIDTTNHYYIYFTLGFICLLSTIAYSVVAIATDRNDRKSGVFWLVVSGATLAWLMKSYANGNYAITFLPLLFVPFADCARTRINKPKLAVLGITMLITAVGFANYLRVFREQIPRMETEHEVQAELRLMSAVPNDAKFIAYNCLPYAYIASGRTPCYPYFVCQDWQIQNGPTLRERVRGKFGSLEAKWILVKDAGKTNVADILMKHYRVVKTDKAEGLQLMKRK